MVDEDERTFDRQVWIAEAASLARARVPRLTWQRAHQLADDLHRQCVDWAPEAAVAWFFGFIPADWPAAALGIEGPGEQRAELRTRAAPQRFADPTL